MEIPVYLTQGNPCVVSFVNWLTKGPCGGRVLSTTRAAHPAGAGTRTGSRTRLWRKHNILRFVDVSDGCTLNFRRNEIFDFLRKKIWNFLEIWKFMNFHEFWRILHTFDEFPCILKDFHWFRLIFIDFHQFPLIFIDFHWFPWIFLDSDRFAASPGTGAIQPGQPSKAPRGSPRGSANCGGWWDLEIGVELEEKDGVYPPGKGVGGNDEHIGNFEPAHAGEIIQDWWCQTGWLAGLAGWLAGFSSLSTFMFSEDTVGALRGRKLPAKPRSSPPSRSSLFLLLLLFPMVSIPQPRY